MTTLKRFLQHAKDTKGVVASRLYAKQVKCNFLFSPLVLFIPCILVGSGSFSALESEKGDSCYPKDFISFKNCFKNWQGKIRQAGETGGYVTTRQLQRIEERTADRKSVV